MEYCKKQMENLAQEIDDLTREVIDLEVDFYSGVKKLMSLFWYFLKEVAVEWQKIIDSCQEGVKKCPHCYSRLYTVKRTFPELVFPFGRIKFLNKKVRCPKCGYRDSLLKWWFPQGLNNRITPFVGEKLVWLSSMLPYREVQYHLKSFWNLDISVRGIQNYVHRNGQKIIQQADLLKGKMELYCEKWDHVYIYVDGVMVYINNRWCEVKVGIIECHRNNKVWHYYHSEKTHWKTFLRHLHEISRKLDCENSRVKLFISDAGRGITSNVPAIFDDYRFLIDYYHASQHISEFLKRLGEKRKAVVQEWRDHLTSLLYKGQIKELVRRMQDLRCGKKNKILLREIAYFEKHEPYLDFATFRRYKWNIGSGSIESACRWLIQQRFKLSGMRWKLLGFNLILNLRLAFFNDRLFPAFDEVVLKEVYKSVPEP